MNARMAGRVSEIEVFAKIVETGSFAAAAQALFMSPSAVSKIVMRIEARLGMPLAIRTTRKLRLTPEGEAYAQHGRKILAEIALLEEQVREASGQIAGQLRISCNVPFGTHKIAPLIPAFLEMYPAVTVELAMTDRKADLVGDHVDIAIRTGALSDSTLRARSLISSPRHVVASPAYLRRMGTPMNPQDLAFHNCITMAVNRDYANWPFLAEATKKSERIEIAVRGNLVVDHGESLRDFAIRGVGIARLSEFHIGNDIKIGSLVSILEPFNPGDREPVWAIYAEQSPISPRIRAFVDFVVSTISKSDQ